MRLGPASRTSRFTHIVLAVACLFGSASLAHAQSSALGLVYSSANTDTQSVIGIFNGTSSTDWMSSGQTVTLSLRDGATGAEIGQWTSPSLKAGVAKQFAITEIEKGLLPGTVKPATYAITVNAAKAGMAVQHIVARAGVLSNATACGTGVSTHGKALLNVRGSLTAGDYPSTVVITNSDVKQSALKIELYDAEGGYFMGSFPTPIIPAGGTVMMSVDAMEAAAKIRPNRFTPSYVVRFGQSFDGGYNFVGFLQNLVNNTKSGAITDLTAYCPIGGPEPYYRSKDGILHSGPVFSSQNATAQSTLQFANTDTVAGTVTLTLQDVAAGTTLGTWTSPSIPVGAARAFSIRDIESAMTAKPSLYSLKVQSTFAGELQHTLNNTLAPVPTDVSTCDYGTGAPLTRLNGVNSSRVAATARSAVAITNTGAAAPATLALYDAETGTRLGSGATPSIPAGGQLVMSIADLEAAAQVAPTSAQVRYVVRLEGAFSGFLQHLVAGANGGAIIDTTVSCRLELPPNTGRINNPPPPGATIADVPEGVDLANLPEGIDLSGISPELLALINSLI